MKKRGICLLPDACYLSELNVPGKPNRTNLGERAAIQRAAPHNCVCGLRRIFCPNLAV